MKSVAHSHTQICQQIRRKDECCAVIAIFDFEFSVGHAPTMPWPAKTKT